MTDQDPAYFDPQSESRDARQLRLAQEIEQERIRLEKIQARYNDTPLRRILRKQNFDGNTQFVI